MPDELERLQINIDADASGTVTGAAQAKQALQGMGNVARKTTEDIRKGMREAAKATENVARAARASQDSVRKTLKPIAPNPVNERGNTSGKKYEFAKVKVPKDAVQSVENVARATQKVAKNAAPAADAVKKMRTEVERVGRKGPTLMHSIARSIRSMLIITAVASALRNFVQWIGKVVSADKQVAASLASVKSNMATAFAPIYSAAIPAIRALVGWLASATAWIATFVSTLFGMSGGNAQEIAKGLTNIGGAAGGAGKQIKELIAPFDELNKLGDTENGGGGGGGGSFEFGEMPEIESAVNAAGKVSDFWTAWGDWVEGGVFAGGITWLLSKFSDLINGIKGGSGIFSSLWGILDGIGGSAKNLGDSLKDVNKNATLTFSETGYDDVQTKIKAIKAGVDDLKRTPCVIKFSAITQNAKMDINAFKRELGEIPADIYTTLHINVDDSATGAMGEIVARYGGGGTSRGGGGGRWRGDSPVSGSASTGGSASNKLNSILNDVKNILGFASGGMNIAKGQLFIANESGAEMIGTIGGKTAVANQQEISGAIWREMQQYKTGGGDAGDIADAVARALNGTAVKVGERQFGTLVVQAVNKNARQAGRVDFAF